MKKIAFLTASVVSVLLASQAFAASNNTITFQGQVTAETCTVTVNGNAANPLVLLPSVNTSELDASGKVAGPTTFDIGITGCKGNDTETTTVSTVFSGNNVTSKGNLGNLATTNAAQNVEIQILDKKNKQPIPFNSGKYIGLNDLDLAAGVKEATATYTAQYYAADTATAGTVEATMQYAISYN
ncbi:fimbrial protein [Pantoea anthophila]|nr:fimbrial protein [Pantoea anthophila]KKB02768.1 fimbrial protein [Pantoea anthophila]